MAQKAHLLRVLALCGAALLNAFSPRDSAAAPFLVMRGETLAEKKLAPLTVLPDRRILNSIDVLSQAARHAFTDDQLMVFDTGSKSFVRADPCLLMVGHLFNTPMVFDPRTRHFRLDLHFTPLRELLATTGSLAFFPAALEAGPCGSEREEPENRPPTAHAGADQAIETAASRKALVALDGTASSDPDGDPLTFLWHGPFGTARGARPKVRLAVDALHALSLTVRDPAGDSAADSVVVSITRAVPGEAVRPPAPKVRRHLILLRPGTQRAENRKEAKAGTRGRPAARKSGPLAQIASITYRFLGFASPIMTPPDVIMVEAGRVVPLTWRLQDDTGGFVSDLDVVTSARIDRVTCDGEESALEDSVQSHATRLRYDAAKDSFLFTWRTAEFMKGRCYLVTVGLTDGSEHPARIHLR